MVILNNYIKLFNNLYNNFIYIINIIIMNNISGNFKKNLNKYTSKFITPTIERKTIKLDSTDVKLKPYILYDSIKNNNIIIESGFIGRGSYSNVYKLKYKENNTKYIIKFTEYDNDEYKGLIFHMLLQHYLIKNKKNNSLNMICNIHEIGTSKIGFRNKYYSIMDNCGEELYSYLIKADTSYDLSGIIELMIRLCECIKIIHDIGYVYLDFKPQNFLIDSNRNIKLIDFGFATKKGTILNYPMGTPLYMSHRFQMPTSNKFICDVDFDLFSIGCFFIQMIKYFLLGDKNGFSRTQMIFPYNNYDVNYKDNYINTLNEKILHQILNQIVLKYTHNNKNITDKNSDIINKITDIINKIIYILNKCVTVDKTNFHKYSIDNIIEDLNSITISLEDEDLKSIKNSLKYEDFNSIKNSLKEKVNGSHSIHNSSKVNGSRSIQNLSTVEGSRSIQNSSNVNVSHSIQNSSLDEYLNKYNSLKTELYSSQQKYRAYKILNIFSNKNYHLDNIIKQMFILCYFIIEKKFLNSNKNIPLFNPNFFEVINGSISFITELNNTELKNTVLNQEFYNVPQSLINFNSKSKYIFGLGCFLIGMLCIKLYEKPNFINDSMVCPIKINFRGNIKTLRDTYNNEKHRQTLNKINCRLITSGHSVQVSNTVCDIIDKMVNPDSIITTRYNDLSELLKDLNDLIQLIDTNNEKSIKLKKSNECDIQNMNNKDKNHEVFFGKRMLKSRFGNIKPPKNGIYMQKTKL